VVCFTYNIFFSSTGTEHAYFLIRVTTCQYTLMSSFWFLLLQIGNRRVLYDAVSATWNDCSVVMKSDVSARNPLLRKFLVKLAQRVALISLLPRSPSWQYKVLNLLLLSTSEYFTIVYHILTIV
jgi:hypothetical protein